MTSAAAVCFASERRHLWRQPAPTGNCTIAGAAVSETGEVDSGKTWFSVLCGLLWVVAAAAAACIGLHKTQTTLNF